MIIVSNATPLIGLASINQFDLLFHLFGKIHIPQAVYREFVTFGCEIGSAKHDNSLRSTTLRYGSTTSTDDLMV